MKPALGVALHTAGDEHGHAPDAVAARGGRDGSAGEPLPDGDPLMSTHTTLTVAMLVVTTVAVVFGAVVAALAYRAADRTSSRSLWLLSCGLGAVALGPLVGALAAVTLQFDAESTLLAQGLLVAPGFVLVVRSLYLVGRGTTP